MARTCAPGGGGSDWENGVADGQDFCLLTEASGGTTAGDLFALLDGLLEGAQAKESVRLA